MLLLLRVTDENAFGDDGERVVVERCLEQRHDVVRGFPDDLPHRHPLHRTQGRVHHHRNSRRRRQLVRHPRLFLVRQDH